MAFGLLLRRRSREFARGFKHACGIIANYLRECVYERFAGEGVRPSGGLQDRRFRARSSGARLTDAVGDFGQATAALRLAAPAAMDSLRGARAGLDGLLDLPAPNAIAVAHEHDSQLADPACVCKSLATDGRNGRGGAAPGRRLRETSGGVRR